ncbi:hypothetical protein [Rhodopila globiformis]|uniref:DUF883 domain-containing protein n=1 Tax=Rhodopila globiformis TaxID=1071 RepID=A0A2S6MZU9_RHOGL|nr:hypothetical protein [Rhodopila globiformis]PPQ27891.1 hypothetical protein CCS01_26135 [Rhodopila globiformis]
MAPAGTSKTEDPKAQLRRLRQEVDALTADRVSPAVADLTARAQHTLNETTTVVRDQTHVVSEQIRQNPFVAIAIGVAAGFVLSRIIRR